MFFLIHFLRCSCWFLLVVCFSSSLSLFFGGIVLTNSYCHFYCGHFYDCSLYCYALILLILLLLFLCSSPFTVIFLPLHSLYAFGLFVEMALLIRQNKFHGFRLHVVCAPVSMLRFHIISLILLIHTHLSLLFWSISLCFKSVLFVCHLFWLSVVDKHFPLWSGHC